MTVVSKTALTRAPNKKARQMNVTSAGSSSNAAQEALETVAQTKAEAKAGDQQAAQKLARTQAAIPTRSVPAPVVTPHGEIDTKA